MERTPGEKGLGMRREDPDVSDLEVVATVSDMPPGQFCAFLRLIERLLEKGIDEKECKERPRDLEAPHVLRDLPMNRADERVRRRCGTEERLEVREAGSRRVPGVDGGGPVGDEIGRASCRERV